MFVHLRKHFIYILYSNIYISHLYNYNNVCIFSGFCSSDSCMPGHRPFTCTNCIMFTENEQLLTSNVCESPSVIFQLEDFDTEILRRYMEVYTASWYWTGYKLIDGVAVIPDTNASVNLNVSTDTCNNDSCCIAWQFNPFGLIAVDCRQAFPVLCTSYVNCKLYILNVQYISQHTCTFYQYFAFIIHVSI